MRGRASRWGSGDPGHRARTNPSGDRAAPGPAPRRRGWVLALVLAVAVGAVPVAVGAGAAAAQSPAREPAISLDRSELRPGESVVVTLSDWPGRVVTLSVCGNAVARGSVDCDMVGSLGVSLARTGTTTLTEFVVVAPPGTCPCVVRAANPTHDHVATAPITLEGVPVGPVVGPTPEAPLAVSVSARPAPAGWLDRARSALGGPTPYDVTVVVENRSSEPVRGLALTGAAVRGGRDDVATLDLDPPPELAPGESWEQVVRATLPAPVWGRVVWEVDASGAGPTVEGEAATRRTPVVLVVAVAVLVLDVVVMLVRALRRRRRRRRAARRSDGEGAEDDVHPTATAGPPVVHGAAVRAAYRPARAGTGGSNLGAR